MQNFNFSYFILLFLTDIVTHIFIIILSKYTKNNDNKVFLQIVDITNIYKNFYLGDEVL